jgi:hypothetical protein
MGKYVYHLSPLSLDDLMKGSYTGRYNGFGGKVDQGETPLEAAKRELEVRSVLLPLLDVLSHAESLLRRKLASKHLSNTREP